MRRKRIILGVGMAVLAVVNTGCVLEAGLSEGLNSAIVAMLTTIGAALGSTIVTGIGAS